jgi:hypothetical protein
MLKDDAEFFRMIYGFFAHGTRLTYAAMGVALLMAVLYFRIIFEDWEGFQEALNEGYTSLFGGTISPRLMLWLMISVGCGFLSYYQFPVWFPHIFGKQ